MARWHAEIRDCPRRVPREAWCEILAVEDYDLVFTFLPLRVLAL
jgi:hypothetical protein